MNEYKGKCFMYCRVATAKQLETNKQENEIQKHLRKKADEIFRSYMSDGRTINDVMGISLFLGAKQYFDDKQKI